jgi:hypothetical protein
LIQQLVLQGRNKNYLQSYFCFCFSGGRLITVRGMNFESAETITVKFSYRKWNAKLEVRCFLFDHCVLLKKINFF